VKLEYSIDAKSDLKQIDEEIRERIVKQIEKLQHNAIPENSRFIELGDLELFRLKLQKKDRNSDLNHRIFYQIINNNKVIVRAIFHRRKGYGKQTKKELESRVKN